MGKFLVSNIANRRHNKIYSVLGNRAFFDLQPSQHGWEAYSSITKGDKVFVINHTRKIPVVYEVHETLEEVALEEGSEFGSRVVSAIGGNTRVLFGKPIERVDMFYSQFITTNGIKSSKLTEEGQMYQGFNCVGFS